MTIHDLRTLLDYNTWATQQLLEAVARLTPEQFTQQSSGDDSLHGQCGHLVQTVDNYRAKLAGQGAPGERPAEFARPGELLAYATQVQERLQGFLNTLREEDLDHVQEITMQHDPIRVTPREVLQHVVNHSTYHRGQIARLLKERGVDYPETDLIGWFTRRRQSGEL